MNEHTPYREAALRPEATPALPPRVFYLWNCSLAFWTLAPLLALIILMVIVAVFSFLFDDYTDLYRMVGIVWQPATRYALVALVLNLRYGRPPAKCNYGSTYSGVALTGNPYYNDG